MARKTPHIGVGHGLGHRDRTRDGLADQRSRIVGGPGRDNAVHRQQREERHRDATTGSSSPSASEPVATRAEQHLTTCREKLRAGDTVIKRAKIGVSNLSERVQARTDPNSGTVDLEEAMRSLTPEGAAEPNEVRRYKAAVKAYGDRRQACQHVPEAPVEIATQLRKYAACGRAQEPVLAAAADLLADWESHHAAVRRSRTGPLHDDDSVLIRTWITAAPHIKTWNKAVAKYQPGKC